MHARQTSIPRARVLRLHGLLIVMLLATLLPVSGNVAGAPIGGRQQAVDALAQESGTDAFGYGDISIKAKQTDVGNILGACFVARSDRWAQQVCDYWDGANDGITTIENLPVGAYEVYMSFAPEGFFFPRSRTGVQVTDGGVTRLVFSIFCCSSKIVIRAKLSTGQYVLGACYEVRDGSANGPLVAPTACDSNDSNQDGKVIVSGLYVEPGKTRTLVIVQSFVPPGYTKARNRTVLLENEQTRSANFTNGLLDLSPSCTYSATSVEPFSTIGFTCTGFASYQELTPRLDGEQAGYGFCDVQGRCRGAVSLPELTGGNHSLKIYSPSHAAGTKSIKVLPGGRIFPSEGKGGTATFVSLAGFKPGEQITIRRQGSSQILAGPVTASAKGSASAVLVIPDGDAATVTFYAEGNQASVAKMTFSRTGPATVKPIKTATPAPTATSTPTAEATEAPTEVPTLAPTEEPTVAAPEEPAPTETPMPEAHTEEPSATAEPPLEEPVLEPTLIDEQSSEVPAEPTT